MTGTPKPRRKKHKTLGAPDSTIRMARKLRKEMSLPEVLLWVQLQQHPGGYQFRKQHPIGDYSLDFCCVKARLAIEVDGISHEMGDRPTRDEVRDAWVKTQGFDTMRIPAVEVLKNMEGVLVSIVEECRKRIPPRNGEVAGGARRRGRVGPDSSVDDGARLQPAPPPPRGGPPPRSGEDLR
jgi:very-short-patch-repair endonuclease